MSFIDFSNSKIDKDKSESKEGWPGTHWISQTKRYQNLNLKPIKNKNSKTIVSVEDQLKTMLIRCERQWHEADALKKLQVPIDGLNDFLDKSLGTNRANRWWILTWVEYVGQ